jgi:hypothetical protein
MLYFIHELKLRNEALFYFGFICLLFAVFCLVMTRVSTVEYQQVNAWNKPFKFAFSTFTLVWAMGWYMAYLPDYNPRFFNWSMIFLLGFEIVYITLMAAQGKASHFNVSTPTYAMLYSLMAFAASAAAAYVGYIGWLFFTRTIPDLPDYYVWSIRLGILIFVVFSFQGFLMGSRMNHSVGALNDNSNLFIVGWSRLVGDLRIAHFVGMHALQVLPLLSFYVVRGTKLTFVLAGVYALLATFTLVQALQGKPLLPAVKKQPKVVAESRQE